MFNLIFVGLSLTLCHVDGFNIESKHYTSYTKESSSMFGFSVAQYRDINKRGWWEYLIYFKWNLKNL